MKTIEQPCSEPGRWSRIPSDDASDAETLAFLQHCEACAYHARMAVLDDPFFDGLLREACEDLDVGDAGARRQPIPPMHLRTKDLPAVRTAQREKVRFGLRLAVACLLVFCLVLGWKAGISLFSGPSGPETAPVTSADVPPTIQDFDFGNGKLIAALARGRVYTARVISDTFDGQATGSGMRYDKESPTAAVAELPFGSRLRVTNPLNNATVEVIVVDRGPVEGQINLSAAAAALLGFDGKMQVIVEVLSTPPPSLLGP